MSCEAVRSLVWFIYMENLWAPWRAEYIFNKKPKECLFCLISSLRNADGKAASDASNYLLMRDRTCFAVLNAFPYSPGHLMVASYRHTGEMNDLTEEELKDLILLSRRCKELLQQVFKPDGFNIGFNVGASAGAGVVDHLHLHVVPRWAGDANFMTVLSNTRVISEGLKQTYEKLMEQIQAEKTKESKTY